MSQFGPSATIYPKVIDRNPTTRSIPYPSIESILDLAYTPHKIMHVYKSGFNIRHHNSTTVICLFSNLRPKEELICKAHESILCHSSLGGSLDWVTADQKNRKVDPICYLCCPLSFVLLPTLLCYFIYPTRKLAWKSTSEPLSAISRHRKMQLVIQMKNQYPKNVVVGIALSCFSPFSFRFSWQH